MGQIANCCFIHLLTSDLVGLGGGAPQNKARGSGEGGSPPRKEGGRAFKQMSSSTLGIQKHGVFGGAPVGKPWFSGVYVLFIMFSFS